MELSIGLIWVGALLILGGVLFTAAKALQQGRLSEANSTRAGTARGTLEPQGSGSRFRLRPIWPGLMLVLFGVILMLAGANI